MASLTRWTGLWASSRRWWRTRKTGVLQATGSQRVRHNGATEQQQSTYSTNFISRLRFTPATLALYLPSEISWAYFRLDLSHLRILEHTLSSSSDSMFLISHLLKCCLPRETCLHLYHITILFYWHTFSEIIYLCKFTFLSYTYCHRGLECRLFETKDFIHFVPSCWIQHLKESRQAFIINQDEQPEPDTPSSLESLENQTKHMKQWLSRQRTSENKRQWT